MKKLLKPASLLFNILCLLVFFLTGVFFAGWIEAGKNQGLAAGAIVLGWGVLFAGLAFIVSFFLTYHLVHKKIVIGNWVLLGCLLLGYGITYYRYQQRQEIREEESGPYREKPTVPIQKPDQQGMLISLVSNMSASHFQNTDPGMGFFSPNIFDKPTLYFYNRPNLEKSILEHAPQDSVTFIKNEYNQFEIATAPPWLVPEIPKMDYDILYFKIKSVTEEFVEVIVNAQTGQTAYLSKQAGKVMYWPEFLLRVNSVELLPDTGEKVKTRALPTSSDVQTTYAFLRPVKIQADWAQVILLNQDLQEVGRGWIRWRREGHLLIRFNLLR